MAAALADAAANMLANCRVCRVLPTSRLWCSICYVADRRDKVLDIPYKSQFRSKEETDEFTAHLYFKILTWYLLVRRNCCFISVSIWFAQHYRVFLLPFIIIFNTFYAFFISFNFSAGNFTYGLLCGGRRQWRASDWVGVEIPQEKLHAPTCSGCLLLQCIV